jgi:hypothetical protein
LLGYGSTDKAVNIFAVGDQMDAKGWQVNRLQSPDGLHAMITAQHLAVMDDYLSDLEGAVAAVRADPTLADKGSAATYGMMAHVPFRGMVKQRVLEVFASMYRAGGSDFDLSAAQETGHTGESGSAVSSLTDRVAKWYVARRQR